MSQSSIQLGLERCLESPPAPLRGTRFGVLCNQASVDSRLQLACDALAAALPARLAAVFTPQHGFWGEQQANMDETPDGVYEPLGVPLHSLYCHRRRPADDMLADLDCLVVDLQDVGTRVYTFLWTVAHCLEACAACGVQVIVLDRPNPLGGIVLEGPPIEPGFESFVGLWPIPMRHGLTLGELARWINGQLDAPAPLEVVPMLGWRREMQWPDCGLDWWPASPNVPRFESLLLYPGQVLLEGTNLSEGRGTTTPFELMGAPFIQPFELARHLQRCDWPGLKLVPIRFRPTFDKWSGQSCGGLALRVTARAAVRSYQSTLQLLFGIKQLWPEQFAWLPPPYEYEYDKMPIDILSGSSRLRETMAKGDRPSPTDICQLARLDAAAWRESTAEYLIYD